MRTLVHGLIAALTAGVLVLSCADQSNPVIASPDAATDTAPPEEDDGGADEDEDEGNDSGLSGVCADTFGDDLTTGFGRLDGVVYAVQRPGDNSCAMPNRDHVVVQVLMEGEVYRMVTNVMSSGDDPLVRFARRQHALPEPAFAEGWHVGAPLDYPSTLDVHNDAFEPLSMDDLVAKIEADVKVGDPISVYAHVGEGRTESAHKVHRNSGHDEDGAIVVSPTSSPTFLLFHFDEQVF